MTDKFKIINDNEQIISLWNSSFGDCREDILYFIDNCKHKSVIGCCDGGKLVSMLVFVDCKINDKNFKYIYAACTSQQYRRCGYMTDLLAYTKTLSDNLVLIPADEALVTYYSDRGFVKKIPVELIKFNESDDIKEYLLEGCSLENPFALIYEGE